jgi:hypothetical protein
MKGMNMNETLSVTYSTFRDWFAANFDDERCDRALRYGFESGAAGLIYDSQTVPLYNEFADEIWDIALDGYLTMQDITHGQVFEVASVFSTFMVWQASYRLAMSRERLSCSEEEEDDLTVSDKDNI